jgi:signal transduction histidine kinase
MRQVLINLINNSVKFTVKGEIEFGYNIVNDSFVEVYVKDTGIGIPRKHHKDVFKRFWQVDASATREYGGTGLGWQYQKPG